MSQTKPLISIIVPVYKVEQYLDECIQSIIHQTYTNLEIILVDDGSPDRCPELCDRYAKLDSRIKVIHKKNGGLSSARNAGIDIAQGEYIGFVDSDDWLPQKGIETLSALLSDESIGIGGGMLEFVKEGKNVTPWMISQIENRRILPPRLFLESILSEEILCSVCNKLYKRVLLKNVRFTLGITNEDAKFHYDLGKVLIKLGLNFVEIPDTIYFYRYNPTSISRGPQYIKSYRCMVDNSLYMLKDIEADSDLCFLRTVGKSRYFSHLIGFLMLAKNQSVAVSEEYKASLYQIPMRFAQKNWGSRHFVALICMRFCPFLLRFNKLYSIMTNKGLFPPITK